MQYLPTIYNPYFPKTFKTPLTSFQKLDTKNYKGGNFPLFFFHPQRWRPSTAMIVSTSSSVILPPVGGLDLTGQQLLMLGARSLARRHSEAQEMGRLAKAPS